MANTNWQQIQDLFSAALDRPMEERASFVREAAGEPALADAVLGLLSSHERPSRLDTLVDRVSEAAAEAVPATIGPYRVVRLLGRGGMGTVYLAERADGQFEHRVALKILRSDRAGETWRRRFLTERQILAQLVHKNIAWLLDGNVTESGSPYLVMEYVEGLPVLEYCDVHRLNLEKRLRLFLDVCAAVEYAHRKLIVHRDLKPGNILVTGDGVVKLLDFGIAKLLDPDPAWPNEATGTGMRLMTPEYASPEQVRGERVGTPSDVYQLGLLAFQLLTGRRPYRVRGHTPSAIELAILSADPLRPSNAITIAAANGADDEQADTDSLAKARSTTAARLGRQLAGDLDHIVLRALRKEPEQRYGSATELAEDVRRHLDGRPVLARRGTVRYRASRFVRRHRVIVAAAILVAFTLAAGILGTTWQMGRAREQARLAAEQRDLARLEAEKASRIATFLTDLFEVAGEGDVRTDTLRLLPVLERGAERLREELADQPEVMASALVTISDLHEKLGRYEDARRYAEAALETRRAVLDAQHPDVAEALDNLTGVLLDLGQIADAGTYAEEAVAIRRAGLTGAVPDSALLTSAASSLHNLAVTNWRQRNLERADSLETEAIALYDSAGTTETTQLASSLDVLGLIRQDLGRPDEAVDLTQRALAIRRRNLTSPHMLIAIGMNNVATALMIAKRPAEAEPLLLESLEMRRALLGDEHPQVAAAIHNLGALYKDLHRDDEAIARYMTALEMRRRLLGPQHLDVALSLSSIALLYHERGRFAEALPLFGEALPLWRRGLGEGHGLSLRTQGFHGDCLSKVGRFEEAERELLAAHEGLVKLVGDAHSETKRAVGFLHALYTAWGRPEDAARYAGPGS
ncbi:MAG: tetratricopeptide repeat protein [Longimicrobiales bacterium]